MKNILTILTLGILLTSSLIFANGESLDLTVKKQASSSLLLVVWLLKIGGFGIIMTAFGNLVSGSKGGDDGGEYINSIIKILIGGVFLGADDLLKSVTGDTKILSY